MVLLNRRLLTKGVSYTFRQYFINIPYKFSNTVIFNEFLDKMLVSISVFILHLMMTPSNDNGFRVTNPCEGMRRRMYSPHKGSVTRDFILV